MKRIRKILAVLLAAVMVMSLGVSVLAEETTTYKIEITNVASTNHTFSAYQIFAGDWDDTSEVLSNVTWGSSVSSASSLVTALKASTTVIVPASVTESDAITLSSLLNSITYDSDNTNASAAAIAAALSSFVSGTYGSTYGETLAQVFADVVAAQINTSVSSTAYATANEGEASGNTYTYTISNLSAGYYLVTDSLTEASTSTTGEVLSDYILQVVDDVNISSKSDVPSISKAVSDSSTGTYSSTSTAAYGDTVYFKIRVTVPDVSDYSTYQMVVLDKLDPGLHFDSSTVAVTVYANSTTSSGTTVASSSYTVATNTTQYSNLGENTFAVVFEDILTLKDESQDAVAVSEGYVIEVTYSAKLEDNTSTTGSETYTNVEVGNTGNTNTASLVYSNNPNNGSGTGTSTTETTTTYTTSITIYKTDGTSFLSGAYFTLYDSDEEVVADAAEVTSEQGLTFSGLDAGTYTLKESTTPSGYNTAEDIVFTLSYDETNGWSVSVTSPSSAGITQVSANSGTFQTTVVNNKGASIPTTGGIGTTIFYVVGAVLVLGAAVILITRRRMGNRV